MSFEYISPAIEKWKLDEFLEIVDSFEDDFADAVHHKVCVEQNYETILLHIVGKSLVTTREILTLCAHGYSDGALSLGRNLYEQMMIVSFFEAHKNDTNFQTYIDDFFLSNNTQRNRCLRDINQYVPNDDIDGLNAEWEALKKRTERKIKGDYWWANCNSFSELISCVMQKQTNEKLREFLDIQYMRYKRACIALHAGCMGNSVRIGSNTGVNVVDTSPSVYGQSMPLMYMAVSLISIMGYACTSFQIEHTKYLKPLNDLAIFYQNQEKDDINA